MPELKYIFRSTSKILIHETDSNKVFCLCMCSLNLYAQISVTGTVNDNTGESLPGVSILAKDGTVPLEPPLTSTVDMK